MRVNEWVNYGMVSLQLYLAAYCGYHAVRGLPLDPFQVWVGCAIAWFCLAIKKE